MVKPPAKVALAAAAAVAVLLAAFLPILLFRRHTNHSSDPSLPLSPPPPPEASTAGGAAVSFDFSPYLIQFKNGTVERLSGTDRVPPSNDTATGVSSKDVRIDASTGVAARIFAPMAALNGSRGGGGEMLPLIVFFHGGAFVIESPFSPKYHRYLNDLAAAANAVAVSVAYRLAPEHVLPTAYDDSWRALNWAIKNCVSASGDGVVEPWLHSLCNATRIFLAGDSVGANIAHNMAMRAGDEGLPAGARIEGMALLDPYFWGSAPVANETTDAATRRQMETTWSFVNGGKFGIDSPMVNPTAMPAAEWRRLACERVAVTVAGEDMLRPRGMAYAAALRRSPWAGEVKVFETEGEGHTYFLSQPAGVKAAAELAFVAGFIDAP